ncbi:PAS domain-containing sensor histidine kinase [Arcobacter sp. LA11]|uniref:PAS domain-containing sensor histidine kinase n=1 Tax=Arcobacter sp. LA11 TaxID=1898176 RepID=UPI000935008D|nr:PAS domain-containing sensor histidine kinase [Arcobacter sp. LA11]
MSNIKIRNLILYIFLVIGIGIALSGTILYLSLNNLSSLNKEMILISDTKNSFLNVKLQTEQLLITKDLAKSKIEWIESIKKFDEDSKFLKPKHQEVFNNSWYISKKEIEKIIKDLNNDILKPYNLEKKSISMLKGEMFALNEKTKFYTLILSLIKKIEFLIQYEEFIFNDLSKLDSMERDNINQQISKTIINTVLFIIITVGLMLIAIFILNKKILKIEQELVDSKKELHDNVIKLEDSKLLLKNIIDTVPVSIFWKNIDGEYMGLNKTFLQECKLDSVDDILGKTDFDLPWKNIKAKHYRRIDFEVINSGESKLQIEETYVRDNGDESFLLKSKVPLKNIQNEIIGVLGVSIDITQTKIMYNELNQKDKLLAQQSKMAAMGEMLENIAHQWRQPLSMISSTASGMEVKKEFDTLDEEYFKEAIHHIMESTSFLNQTIEDFRNYFKEDKEIKEFTITKSLDKALFISDSRIKNRSIKVVKNAQPLNAFGLENEFIQIIMNIINNAIDVLDEKNISEKIILIETNQTDKYTELSIHDNGGGIPHEILNKVFEAYFTTKDFTDGTGIGLHMSRDMIEKHMSGFISVSNEEFIFDDIEYIGAKFILRLPSNEVLV